MNPWIFSSDWRARLTLIFCVACFYSGVVLIDNKLLFFWASDSSYRYWIYPPAGVRLILIMLLGWPGLIGYAIASVAVVYSDLIPEITRFSDALLVVCVRALSIWFALMVYGWLTKVKTPWQDLTWGHVPFLALFVNFVSVVAVTIAWVHLGVETMDTFIRNIALQTFGDTMGTVIVLVIILKLRKAYTQSQQSNQTQSLPG